MQKKSKIKITAVIPVKANSQRVKKKNLRKFSDTNLFELKLKQLKYTKNFYDLYVSSENKSILNTAKKLGYKTHYRDPRFSTPKVPMSAVYKHIAQNIEAEYIAWINVTNPLVDTKYYDQAAKLFKKLNKKKYDCLLSAVKNKENFFYRGKPINFKRTPWPRSQDLEPLISLPFAFSILKKSDLVNWRSCVGKKPKFFFLDPIDATDIDEIHNFRFCEFIYNERKKKIHTNKKK